MLTVEKFRGFAFVTMEKKEYADSIMDSQPHKILGKEIHLKIAFTKEQARQKLLEEKDKKVFVSGLPVDHNYGSPFLKLI